MYKQFVSLGQACPVSASMSKWGLRSWSGPFDWLIANDFEYILHYIDNDFQDFLLKENLTRYKNSPKMFMCMQSGFIFMHNKDLPFENNYERLREIYWKKIDNFLEKTKEPTCFLRGIVSQEEIDYINDNFEYINRIIKKNNTQNEIIFLLCDYLPDLTCKEVKFYRMSSDYKGTSRKLLRGWFDGADEFLEYCIKNFSELSLIKNITFDREKEESLLMISEGKNSLFSKLAMIDYTKLRFPSEKIIIFGCGDAGMLFYSLIKNRIDIDCFVDIYKAGEEVDGIPIMNIHEVEYKGVVVVTPVHNFSRIKASIERRTNGVQVISLNEIESFIEKEDSDNG